MSDVPIHLVVQIYCLGKAVFPDQIAHCYQHILGPCAIVKLVVNKREPEWLKPAVSIGERKSVNSHFPPGLSLQRYLGLHVQLSPDFLRIYRLYFHRYCQSHFWQNVFTYSQQGVCVNWTEPSGEYPIIYPQPPANLLLPRLLPDCLLQL